ncbi:MAG: hypothetical protein ABIC36_00715 [bacterium]
MRERALQLVLAIYRLTNLFPGGEVLICQMRQAANQVLTELVLGRQKQAIVQIKILLNYFQICQAQNWIRNINFVILKREYGVLLDKIKQSSREKKIDLVNVSKIKGLTQRQKKIFEYIKKHKLVRMKNLSILFPKLTSRTISNDLNEMISRKILFHQGRGRSSFYKLTFTN